MMIHHITGLCRELPNEQLNERVGGRTYGFTSMPQGMCCLTYVSFETEGLVPSKRLDMS